MATVVWLTYCGQIMPGQAAACAVEPGPPAGVPECRLSWTAVTTPATASTATAPPVIAAALRRRLLRTARATKSGNAISLITTRTRRGGRYVVPHLAMCDAVLDEPLPMNGKAVPRIERHRDLACVEPQHAAAVRRDEGDGAGKDG